MIVITGAAGFIGSCLVSYLNSKGHISNLVVVDDFYKHYKDPNLHNKNIREWIHRDIFLEWFDGAAQLIDFVFHLGARTDTLSTDKAIFDKLNRSYSESIWKLCTKHGIPLVYASSAATYGSGEHRFDDGLENLSDLSPLNEYALSKNDFDIWARNQNSSPPRFYGLKFFNVYGPNEYHKGRMASVIYHAYQQVRRKGSINLFKSHHPDYRDGEQKRDFIYVMDLLKVCHYLMENEEIESGIYNLGTGQARTFNDLALAIFSAMEMDPQIDYIPTPQELRDKYQYFTEARMDKLISTGYAHIFTSIEDGVKDYIKNYLPGHVNF